MTWRIEDIDDDGGVLVGAEITIESDDEQHNIQHGRFDEVIFFKIIYKT